MVYLRARRRRLTILFGALALAVYSVCTNAAEVLFVYVGDPASDAYSGAQQGLSEANAQGAFLNIRYQIIDPASAAQQAINPVAVITDVSAADLTDVLDRYRDLPVLNTTAAESYLRESCVRNLFHVGPSDAMLADAERQWRSREPESKARAYTWHRSFRKYAASQLNSRFKEASKREMIDDSWAGWAAVRLLADTIARDRSLSGERLTEILTTNLAFDGQKGTDMSFRETGQLRQPLLLVERDEIVGEAPVRGAAGAAGLDSLGVLFCAK